MRDQQCNYGRRAVGDCEKSIERYITDTTPPYTQPAPMPHNSLEDFSETDFFFPQTSQYGFENDLKRPQALEDIDVCF